MHTKGAADDDPCSRSHYSEIRPAVDAENGPPIQTRWGPETFLVIEKWDSMDALKAHAGAPHMAAYGAKTRDLIASRVIHILSPLAP
jgi:quinol monooxygenase YgiN